MSDFSSAPSRPQSPLNDQTPTPRPYRFTWDPASRRPGPESVSGTTEGHQAADYFSQPTPTPFPLGALNASAPSLALTALPNEWSSSRHGFHAISTVLNNPHKKQAPPKPHSSLPAVPPADLPRVRRKDFDSYLRAVAPEWERFERNNRLGKHGQAQLDLSTSSANDSPDAPAPASYHPPSSPLTPVQSRTIPPLDSVPSVFFEPNFNLGDPRTFAKVTEQQQPDKPNGSASASDSILDPSSSLSHTPPLLDRFSHYADTVEQHLVREISLRSTSFFAALTNLQDLQSESDVCLDRISKLRGLLRDVDEKTAKKGLEIVRRTLKMDNLVTTKEAVRGVGGVVEMTKVARGLVGTGQWGQALNVVEELERMWDVQRQYQGKNISGDGGALGAGRLPSMLEEGEDEAQSGQKLTLGFPLSVLTAFSELPNHLRALTLEIATSLSQELVVVLRLDLEERLNRSRSSEEVKLNGHDGSKGKDEGLRDKLKPLLQNLSRTKGIKDAISSWREIVRSEVRDVMSGSVPGFEKEWDEEKDDDRAGLIQHLKNMQHTDFMPMLQRVYKHLLVLIESIQTQNNIINDLLDSIRISAAQKKQSVHKPPPIPNVSEDLNDLLSSVTELANTQSSKLLHHRAESHSLLPLSQFLALYYDSMAFVVKCEVICRRMIIGLRGVVIRQASVFLSKFHQGRIERCAKVVLDEMWNQVDVSKEVQFVVDVLVGSAVGDAEELRVKAEGAVFGGANGLLNGNEKNGVDSPAILRMLPPMKSYAQLSEMGAGEGDNSGPSPASKEPSKSGTKHLKIEDRLYFVVAATKEVLVLLVDYLKIVVNLSTLTKDTISKVVEFLMTFNSRTCQLVLGAGAMRSAGLKHITAKHLALASQSLSVMSELIPYVRETFRRHLNQAEAVLLVDFDKLKRDYQVHQTEIHAKLISIMGDRLTVHIESLKAIDWNQPSDGGVNAYMQTLVKETVTLHKVLSRYLSTAVVQYVMTEVFAGINHRLSEVYGKIELPNQETKARLLADAKYLHKELSGLRNIEAPMGMLETVVSEKQLPRATVPVPSSMPTPTRANTLTANQRLKGLLSRSSTSVNSNVLEKALPVPDQNAGPRMSTSTPPPPPLPAKSPAVIVQNPIASMSTLGFGSEPSASASSLALNMSDRVMSASPPLMNGRVTSPDPEPQTSTKRSQSPQHDGRDDKELGTKTPVESPRHGSPGIPAETVSAV